MAVDELAREQGKALSHDDLSAYRGQWVALRDGRVIASDFDAATLRDKFEVESTDELTPVPLDGDGIYIL